MNLAEIVARAQGKKAIAFDIYGVLLQSFEKNLSQPFAMQRPISSGLPGLDPGPRQHSSSSPRSRVSITDMTWQEVFTLREELLYSSCLLCKDLDACAIPRTELRYPHSLHGVTAGGITWQQLAGHVRSLAHSQGYDQLTQEAVALICHPSASAAVVCPKPAGVELLQAIKKLVGAQRCYILSNISQPSYEHNAEVFSEIFSCFAPERVYTPSRAGALKPDPHIFESFLAEYDLQPHECLFIDDTQKNVAAAQLIGIDAVLFK